MNVAEALRNTMLVMVLSLILVTAYKVFKYANYDTSSFEDDFLNENKQIALNKTADKEGCLATYLSSNSHVIP